MFVSLFSIPFHTGHDQALPWVVHLLGMPKTMADPPFPRMRQELSQWGTWHKGGARWPLFPEDGEVVLGGAGHLAYVPSVLNMSLAPVWKTGHGCQVPESTRRSSSNPLVLLCCPGRLGGQAWPPVGALRVGRPRKGPGPGAYRAQSGPSAAALQEEGQGPLC